MQDMSWIIIFVAKSLTDQFEGYTCYFYNNIKLLFQLRKNTFSLDKIPIIFYLLFFRTWKLVGILHK